MHFRLCILKKMSPEKSKSVFSDDNAWTKNYLPGTSIDCPGVRGIQGDPGHLMFVLHFLRHRKVEVKTVTDEHW